MDPNVQSTWKTSSEKSSVKRDDPWYASLHSSSAFLLEQGACRAEIFELKSFTKLDLGEKRHDSLSPGLPKRQ
jgi:hypothetical protein